MKGGNPAPTNLQRERRHTTGWLRASSGTNCTAGVPLGSSRAHKRGRSHWRYLLAWSLDYAGGVRQARPGIRDQACAGQLAEQQPVGTGAAAGRTLTPGAQLGTYVSGDADFHFVGGVSWGCASPWGPGPPASAAPLEEASGVLGPRPLSAQARILLDPHPHPNYHSADSVRRLRVRPTRPSQPASPFLRLRAEVGVRTGGACQQPLLGFWGDLYLDSRVCVCESYNPIIDVLL